ncbi:MAG: PEP-CTERM sorting domain-containing protein, partial [Verrucomicrobiota bacterium]
MNRSLRNLALLGLLALGVSTAGAQTAGPLFNVSYNSTNYQLTITPTNASASGAISGITFLPEYGVNLDSFFPVGANLTANSALPGTISGSIRATSHSGSAMNAAYVDSIDPRDLNLTTLGQGSMTFASTGPAFVNNVTTNPTAPMIITFESSFSSKLPLAGFTGGSVYAISSANTEVTIGTYTYSVVPEPSTYAAIAGALGLAYAVYRRRQAAAATA